MEIKTNRLRESSNASVLPPPDTGRRGRKKAPQKLAKNHMAGKRFASAIKTAAKLCAFLLATVFMLSVFVYAYNSEKFNLRKVTLYGCKEIDPRELEDIIRQDFPKNVLRIDLQRLKRRLEKETWVRRLEIRRVLPSDLIICVEERTPSVILEIHREMMMADKDGTLLHRYDPKYGKLDVPVFKGVLADDAQSYRLYQEENAARVRQGLEMLAEIESGSPSYARQISEVDVSDRKNLKILLVNDTAEIFLGDQDYLKRFRTLMDNLGQYRQLKDQYSEFSSIDMRYEGQIIWRPSTAAAERNPKAKKLESLSRVKSE